MKAIDIYATVPELTEDKVEEQILDSTTLEIISITTNIPVEYFLKKLKLKESEKFKTFGSLKKQYGFEVNDVRKLINDYKDKSFQQ